MTKRRVMVVVTGHYDIDEETLTDGRYGDSVHTFEQAVAYDKANIDDGNCSPEEYMDERLPYNVALTLLEGEVE